ncbi:MULTISPECIES: glycosyltransferase [Bacillaceae]|uniref:glycosyltransferase n=1 Tax=Bacillaceae TaxID=186817 RepID=UPI000BF98C11|nr:MULTISPECIES: glycosyltransferase [Bacillaceae]PEZ83312.1 hypothetical protein CN380_02805 [Bacillus sp. AFS017274]
MKTRILHLLSSNAFSGAENVVINMIGSMADEFEFVYVSPNGSIENVLVEKNIPYIPLIKMNPYYLNQIFRKWKPDIIHAHDFRASINSVLSLYPCTKISHLHQNPIWLRQINLRSLTYMSTCFSYKKILTVSKEILDEAIFSKIVSDKSFILKNNVNIQNVINSSLVEHNNLNYDIAFIGRLTEVKNPLRFIEIVKNLVLQKPSIKVVMIGDGNLKDECIKKIKEYNIEKNIKMTGFLENPFVILKNSKLLAITSNWEGFGLVAVEAMALGKPVIATPVGGLKSIINENCGYFCETDKEFVERIIKILDDESHYIKLSEQCKKESMLFDNQQEWVSKIKELYELEK